MKTENPIRGIKYHELAKAFADDFIGTKEFTTKELSDWAKEHGYPKFPSERKDVYTRRIIRYLRTAGDHSRMEGLAFRIVNRGWHLWQKELITPEILKKIQHESYEKMMGVAVNGKKRDERSRNVLLDRSLSSKDISLVQISPEIYRMLIKSLQSIQTNWQELTDSLLLAFGEHQQLKDNNDAQE
jgi:hypothetical protein